MIKTRKLTTCSVAIATATVLTAFSKAIPAPWMQGGSITLAATAPIMIVSIVLGTKWGLCVSCSYAIIQILLFGFVPPPAHTIGAFFGALLFDYIFACGILGTAGFFHKRLHFPKTFSAVTVMCVRYFCHIISGVFVWGEYVPHNQSVWIYSLIYNGSYMIPETVISAIILFLFFHLVPTKFYDNF